jgi:hypothetical protein
MLVVLYFVFNGIEDCHVSCPMLCYRCYRGLLRLVVLCFVIYAIEDLED